MQRYTATHVLPCYKPGIRGVWDHFLAVVRKKPIMVIPVPHTLAFTVKAGHAISEIETFITNITLKEQVKPVIARKILPERKF